MNHHQRHTPPGAKRTLHYCTLLLAAALTSPKVLASLHWPNFRTAPAKPAAPGYLSSAGAPGLRFQEVVVPPARPAARPTAATARADKPVDAPDAIVPADAAPPTPERTAITAAAVPADDAPPQKKSGPSQRILPDAARPTAHPEDFLPYFRFPSAPGKTGGVDVVVPVPPSPSAGAPLPPSSATYIQSSK